MHAINKTHKYIMHAYQSAYASKQKLAMATHPERSAKMNPLFSALPVTNLLSAL